MDQQHERRYRCHYSQWGRSNHSVHEWHVVASNSSPSPATSVTIASNAGDLTASAAITDNAWVTPFTNQALVWGIDQNAAGATSALGRAPPRTRGQTSIWVKHIASQARISRLPSSDDCLTTDNITEVQAPSACNGLRTPVPDPRPRPMSQFNGRRRSSGWRRRR